MLRALVRNNATKAAIGVIYDPQSAKAAHAAGVGATVTLALGGKSGISGDAPYKETFIVEKLSDGQFVAPGPYYGGRDMDMGPSACLRIGDVRVVVSSHKAQLADQSMYRYVGIEPTEQSITSSTELRCISAPISDNRRKAADLRRARVPADTAALPWTRLRPGIRIKPNGPLFHSQSQSFTYLLQPDGGDMPNIDRIEALPDRLTAIRRDLHAHPRSASRKSHLRHRRRQACPMGHPGASRPRRHRRGRRAQGQGYRRQAHRAARRHGHCRWRKTPI
jgi:hypothetical protein